jgi:hypothetical protein
LLWNRQEIRILIIECDHQYSMQELTINLHMHTVYSDGSGTHADLGKAGLKAGLDAVLVTDHNAWVQGVDAYYREGKKRCLLIAGEEIHDQDRDPQKNHLLVFNAGQELSGYADDPQILINAVQRAGGMCFLAHPIEQAMPAFGETDISWESWEVTGFTGIELWNGFSEFKSVAKGRLDAIYYAFFPQGLPHGPLPRTLQIWDDLLSTGRRVVAIGGSDAHALRLKLGPIRRTVFPYEYHFSAINTHLIVPERMSGELSEDRRMIFQALAGGHCFVGYDLPASTRGFRYSAHGKSTNGIMGDEVPLDGAVTLQAKLPSAAEMRLIKDGICVREIKGEALTYITEEPGAFRIEAYRRYLGVSRGWIFSNPIYVREKKEISTAS